VRGYFLPLGGRTRRVCAGRIMLAGDAAGFVDPFTGEGIRYAILSGRTAAAVATEALRKNPRSPEVDSYPGRCDDAFAGDLRYARFLLRAFLVFNQKVNSLLFRRADLFERLIDVLMGRGTYRQFVGDYGSRLPGYWLRGIAGKAGGGRRDSSLDRQP
jgi:flavin-dependent dehydrogenase